MSSGTGTYDPQFTFTGLSNATYTNATNIR